MYTMKNSDKETDKEKDTVKKSEPNIQSKPDDKRVPTVTPANDNGEPGPAKEKN